MKFNEEKIGNLIAMFLKWSKRNGGCIHGNYAEINEKSIFVKQTLTEKNRIVERELEEKKNATW